MNDILESKIKKLPLNSGVYLMKNNKGEIIYVGKAKILKNRVTQYFRKSSTHTPKVLKMVENIEDFEYIITNNEMEALILEANLIKKYRPYYNILMRDDKTYPYIKLTLDEEYPRLTVSREYKNDKNKYFGPYANATYAKNAVKTINEIYPLAMCKKELKSGVRNGKVCLNNHIGLCSAPCQGNVNAEEYNKNVKEVIDILNGKNTKLIKKFEAQMNKASEELDFETASKLRDKIYALKSLSNQQNVENANTSNMDILGLSLADDLACVQVFTMRNKKIVGRENYILKGQNEKSVSDVLSAFLKQFYTNIPFIPPLILIQEEIEDQETIAQMLSTLKGQNVSIKIPVRGEKKKLLTMASDNAKLNLSNIIGKEKQKIITRKLALKEINEKARMEKDTPRYEAYDISNISGTDSVGVMVVYQDGVKQRKAYRKFRIKTVEHQDDYASMVEVVFRRLNRALSEIESNEENPKFLPIPDIIFADGGKAHVNAIKNVVDTFEFKISVFGLVKDSRHHLRALVNENGEEILLKSFNNARFLLNDISEEVHRFAIDYHRNLRSKSFFKSSLEQIDGVGKVKCLNLLKAFKNMENIKNASMEDLLKVDGINEKLAYNIMKYFEE